MSYHHLIVKVTGFETVRDWTLCVRFDDGTSQVIDFLPVLWGELFAPLRDKSFFAQVKLDPEWHTLVWPNGADFDPETLHGWPKYAQALRAQVTAGASAKD